MNNCSYEREDCNKGINNLNGVFSGITRHIIIIIIIIIIVVANCMKLNISKTKVISFSRKTNVLIYGYKLCQSSITRIDSIKNLGVFIDAKLHFHDHVN
jgi:hypothetical protein